MNDFTLDQYDQMKQSLQQIAVESENIIQRAEQSYKLVQATLMELKQFILTYTFKDKEEEILFFKEIKPKFLKELIYHNEVYFFEAGKPLGSKKILFAYYNQVLERIRIFFDRHQVLYTYYRTGKTAYDEVFFLREASSIPILPDYALDMDTRFCTIESFKLSKLQAYEMLYEYLQTSIAEIDNIKSPKDFDAPAEPTKNIWTDPKATLIELAYAIQARGSVDHGKADVKQIIEALQIAFHIDLGNYYGVFTQNIRLRKKNRTVYLDQLIEYLKRRMDDLDE